MNTDLISFCAFKSFHIHQAIKEGGPSEICVDSLRGLCETLVPGRSVHLAADQLTQADEEQETQPGATVLPYGR